jgi:HEAT repeat protein
MSERYEPASIFLKAVIAEQVSLHGSDEAEANLRRLIAMTTDSDTSNRDWATLLLSQADIDTPEVRAALLRAAGDRDPIVRSEAMLGLAQRDTKLALPLVQKELQGECASLQLFEAAELIADRALVDCLEPWTEASDWSEHDQAARDALAACSRGLGPKAPAAGGS